MNQPLKWEFPGGKIDPGEQPEGCLRREIFEELGLNIDVGRALPPSTHRYPSFTITLYPFVCAIESGSLTLNEHAAFIWADPEELKTLDWSEADVGVVKSYLDSIKADLP